ncbi:hypothetical protein Scep_009772 [Stephania cephalantha]|uniref:Uncharacterized protein n=1 Tax=Stephania cephalantha TaxID=152367 RepID=A0AAP0JTR6_9MAGN
MTKQPRQRQCSAMSRGVGGGEIGLLQQWQRGPAVLAAAGGNAVPTSRRAGAARRADRSSAEEAVALTAGISAARGGRIYDSATVRIAWRDGGAWTKQQRAALAFSGGATARAWARGSGGGGGGAEAKSARH